MVVTARVRLSCPESLSFARFKQELPGPGESLKFLVSIHEEGTDIARQQNAAVSPDTERFLVQATDDLYEKSS